MSADVVVVEPYSKVGAIEFGASVADVARLLGAPEFVRTTRRGEREERRGETAVTYSSSGNVAEVTFLEPTPLVVRGVDLFRSRESYRELLSRGYEALEDVGVLVFLDLGLSLWGFHAEESGVTVTCFARGRFDSLLPGFRRFDLR